MTSRDRLEGAVERAGEVMADKMAEVKPKLRGWLHACTAPLALAAGIVLVALSPTASTRVGSTAFALSALLRLHRLGDLPPRHVVAAHVGVPAALRPRQHLRAHRRHLHALRPAVPRRLGRARRCCSSCGRAAIGGVLFRVFWTDAPRWLYTPMYLALGWAAVFFIPQFVDGAERFSSGIAIATLVLVAVGGILYTLGGVVYGLKRPNPSPRWFGFHEVFHSFTVLAFAAHYVGVSLATYSLR